MLRATTSTTVIPFWCRRIDENRRNETLAEVTERHDERKRKRKRKCTSGVVYVFGYVIEQYSKFCTDHQTRHRYKDKSKRKHGFKNHWWELGSQG